MLTEMINMIKDIFSPAIEVTGDTALKTDLQLDSFEIINLIGILEDKYNVDINVNDIVSLITIEDICNYIANKKSPDQII
ncbi:MULTISPECIES: acyl carrier protein [Anaerotignum]|uniref:acyl carrier protein n=1 Tax=Anaerotignum TaxID=2039240 RepID=UPI002108A6C1|nr:MULTISPECIES: phosphopantetheine-binding protein [Anaerotignum]MCQ4936451.1 phosphopantetheine-binding protein [Anaerotignum propionicum]